VLFSFTYSNHDSPSTVRKRTVNRIDSRSAEGFCFFIACQLLCFDSELRLFHLYMLYDTHGKVNPDKLTTTRSFNDIVLDGCSKLEKKVQWNLFFFFFFTKILLAVYDKCLDPENFNPNSNACKSLASG